METVCELINLSWPVSQNGAKHRQWVSPGLPCFLGNQMWMQIERVRDDDTDTVKLQTILKRRGKVIGCVPACTILGLSESTGIRIVPRAIEKDDRGPQRVYMEFTRTDIASKVAHL